MVFNSRGIYYKIVSIFLEESNNVSRFTIPSPGLALEHEIPGDWGLGMGATISSIFCIQNFFSLDYIWNLCTSIIFSNFFLFDSI